MISLLEYISKQKSSEYNLRVSADTTPDELIIILKTTGHEYNSTAKKSYDRGSSNAYVKHMIGTTSYFEISRMDGTAKNVCVSNRHTAYPMIFTFGSDNKLKFVSMLNKNGGVDYILFTTTDAQINSINSFLEMQ